MSLFVESVKREQCTIVASLEVLGGLSSRKMIFKGVYEKFQQDMGRLGPLSRFLFVVVVLVPFPAWAYPVYEVSNRVYATIMHPDQPYQTAKIISNSDKEKGVS